MKFIFLNIQLLLIALGSFAQTVPWTYAPTSKSHLINISAANITVDNTALEAGDAVGLFYDSLGYLACGGFAVWPAAQITAYGDDSGEPNGFSTAGSGEPFQFKIWKKKDNCIVDSGTIIQFQYLPPTFNDSIFFKVNGTSKMLTLNGSKKEIYYAQTNYCISDPNPLPIKVGTINDVTYTSQAGLVINATTGLIDIAASQPGTYTVFFQTSLCLIAESFTVKIKLNIDNLSANITKSTCTELGQLKIDGTTIQCGVAPFQYRLRNILSGQQIITASNTIIDIPDATYELFVKDASNDEVKWKNFIIISKDCKDLIIAPYSVDRSSYFIPFEGKAKIYDRIGSLRKEITIPADWDATDETGNLVPMGQYIIICNDEKQIVVTVIK